jgi:hypothetical protein
MSLCATCGRPRSGTAPFCAGCGTRFADAADAAEPAGAEVTRWDTHVGIPGGSAQSASPPAGPPTVVPPVPVPPTVVASAPVPPPSVPPDPWSRPGPVPPGPAAFGPPPPPRRGRAGLGVALVIVAVLAVGGGAFALVSALTAHKNGTQAAGQPTPSASSTAAASPATGPAGGTVAVAPAVAGDPAAPQVRALLERYFTAINDHDYAAFGALLDARLRQQNTKSSFATGYATTHDSAETLTSIRDDGGGELAATVSFTSHQSPADSIDNSPCMAWTITLYLRPQGSGYLIGTPPSGYKPAYQSCP